MEIRREYFGKTETGELVTSFRLINKSGMEAVVLDYGCTLKELWISDRYGKKRNVVLGYPDFKSYERNKDFLGACVGRFGGWIQNSELLINGQQYFLHKTDGKNHLHGGKKGFDKYVWQGSENGGRLTFFRLSANGEENYPGNLKVWISYELTEQNELKISYEGDSDQDTICNLTNHSYFNLEGQESTSVLEQELWLNSEWVQSDNPEGISDSELFCTEGTPFDFRKAKKLGRDLNLENLQLRYGHGYDHNYYLGSFGPMKEAACLYSRQSGIEMRVRTNQSGIQLYTGKYLTANNN